MHVLSSAILSSGSLIDLDGTLFVQLVVFLAVFGVLRMWVFRPMLALFEARRQAIDGVKEAARVHEREAQAKVALFESEMKRAKTQAAEERDRLREGGQLLEQDLLLRVRSEVDTKLRHAEATLARQRQALENEVQANTPVLARAIASRVLRREVP